MRPRPGRNSRGRRGGDQVTERVSGGGRDDRGGERERPPGREQRSRGGMKMRSKLKTPRDDRTPRGYQRKRVQERKRGGGEMPTRQGIHQKGRGRAAMCLGTSRPRRTYVSGRSMGTGFMGTRAHILTAASTMNQRGKRGDVTLRSCHRGAMTRRVGRSADSLSGRWGWSCRGCGTGGGTRNSSSSSRR